LGAEERILAIEQQLFSELVSWMMQFISQIQTNASGIARLDNLAAFATLAQEHGYVRPVVDDSRAIDIKQGRHPVIEKQLPLDPI